MNSTPISRKQLTKMIYNLGRKIARLKRRLDNWENDPSSCFGGSLAQNVIAAIQDNIRNLEAQRKQLCQQRDSLKR